MSIVEYLVTTLATSSAERTGAAGGHDSLSGGLDATWGTGGTVSLDAGSLVGVADQPDGEIVAVPTNAGDLPLVSYIASGQPDGTVFDNLAGQPDALVVTAGGGWQSLAVLASFTSSAMALAEVARTVVPPAKPTRRRSKSGWTFRFF